MIENLLNSVSVRGAMRSLLTVKAMMMTSKQTARDLVWEFITAIAAKKVVIMGGA